MRREILKPSIAIRTILAAVALAALAGCNRECCCDSECARPAEHAPIGSAGHTEPIAKVPVKPDERKSAMWRVESALIDSFLSVSGRVRGGAYDLPSEQFDRSSGELNYIIIWEPSSKSPDSAKEELVNAQLKIEYQNGRWVCVVKSVKGRETKTFVEALTVYSQRAGVAVISK